MVVRAGTGKKRGFPPNRGREFTVGNIPRGRGFKTSGLGDNKRRFAWGVASGKQQRGFPRGVWDGPTKKDAHRKNQSTKKTKTSIAGANRLGGKCDRH